MSNLHGWIFQYANRIYGYDKILSIMKQTFPGQQPDEKVLLIFRRNIVSLTRAVVAFVILGAIGLLPYLIVPTNKDLIFIALAGFLLGLIVFFYHWIGWYFSYYIVTNQRVRYTRQKGLFNRSVVEIWLNRVQSVAVNTSGIISSLLNYGVIVLHTQVGDMIIDKVSKSEDVYGIIQGAINEIGVKDIPDEEEPENS